MSVKTRFAPSPTGDLHIGGARTALYSWLHARSNNGQFVLRIEDTDIERSTPEAVQAIMDGMKWLELDWDEGPIFQTHRFERYKEVIDQLLSQGDAYPCFCTSERLDLMREEQKANKEKWRYDGKCRNLSQSEIDLSQDHVIRFKNPKDGAVTFKDVVKGEITISNQELDDLIIARTDGAPTYNFTVVVDDMDMAITQVIRGDDHINNTPRQINIFKALNATPPEYGHVPMILGDDGKKLSKRHGAVSVMQYRDDGYLPHAVLNYLVRLGWSHGDQEIFSLVEMKKLFDVNHINKAPSAFNTEKLNWLNQQYIRSTPIEQLLPHLQWHLEQQNIQLNDGPEIGPLIAEFSERIQTLKDLAVVIKPYYVDFEEFDAKAAKKHLRPVAREALEKLLNKLESIDDWSPERLQTAVDETASELDVGMGKVGMPVRVAITGAGMSPAIDLTLHWVGKARSIARINKAIDFIKQRESQN